MAAATPIQQTNCGYCFSRWRTTSVAKFKLPTGKISGRSAVGCSGSTNFLSGGFPRWFTNLTITNGWVGSRQGRGGRFFLCFMSILLRRPVSSSNKSSNTGRPTDQIYYPVVCEYYMDRRMRGEALLGDLPSNWHGLLNVKG